MSTDIIVRKLEPIVRALAECSSAAEAKQLADLARAAEVYARRQKLGEEAIGYATAIKVDALTLLGEFQETAKKNKGTAGKGRPPKGGSSVEPPKDPTPTLAEVGLGKKESTDAQALAALKREAPEIHEQVRAGEITTRAGATRARQAKGKKKKKAVAAAAQAIPADAPYRVEQGDCLGWFAAQPAGSFHLVFGSPPYEQARTYQEDGQDYGIARDTDAWVGWMVDVYRAALRCCTGLVAFVVEGQTRRYRWTAGPALLMAALHREGVHLRKPPVFHRVGIPGSGGPDWLRNDYEFIVCATNGGQLPWSDNTALGQPPKYQPGGDPSHRTRNGRRVNVESGPATMGERGSVGHHRARWAAGSSYAPPELANPGNVIACTVGGGNIGDSLAHDNEAPFPEALAEFFVRSFCPPGGVVCDPFSGSGTTGAVAVRHHRRFAGCDLRPSQVDLSLRRIARVQPLLPLEESAS